MVDVALMEGCQIKVQLPYPDYDVSTNDISSIEGHGLLGSIRTLTYKYNYYDNSILITDGC